MSEPNTKDILLSRKIALFNSEVNRLIPVDFTFRADPAKLLKLKEEYTRIILEIKNNYPNAPVDDLLSKVEFKAKKVSSFSKHIALQLMSIREKLENSIYINE
jgi:hypothetical protein